MFRKLKSVVLKIIVSFVLTRPFGKNLTLVEPKMTKINALFMTKTAEKPYSLGLHNHTYIHVDHIRKYP